MQEKAKPSRGWRIATVFFAIALIGATAAILIPAFAGIDSASERPGSSFGPMLWAGLLGLGLCKLNNWNGFLGFVAGLLIGFAVLVLGKVVVARTNQAEESAAAIAQIEQEIAQLNSKLPMLFEDGSRFDKAEFRDFAYHFYYTQTDYDVNNPDWEIDFVQIKEALAADVCSDANVVESFSTGVLFNYHYADMNDNLMDTVTISDEDCPDTETPQ